jgi:hypothetical protein
MAANFALADLGDPTKRGVVSTGETGRRGSALYHSRPEMRHPRTREQGRPGRFCACDRTEDLDWRVRGEQYVFIKIGKDRLASGAREAELGYTVKRPC